MSRLISPDKRCLIYGLVDPRINEIRYVGKTVDLAKRRSRHLRDAHLGRSHANSWLLGLIAEGLKPAIVVLDRVADADWANAEVEWIARLRRAGLSLTNMDPGGRGCHGPRNPETLSKMSAANKGKTMSLESRQKISASLKGRSIPLERRAKISAALMGHKSFVPSDDPEFKRRKSEAARRAWARGAWKNRRARWHD